MRRGWKLDLTRWMLDRRTLEESPHPYSWALAKKNSREWKKNIFSDSSATTTSAIGTRKRKKNHILSMRKLLANTKNKIGREARVSGAKTKKKKLPLTRTWPRSSLRKTFTFLSQSARSAHLQGSLKWTRSEGVRKRTFAARVRNKDVVNDVQLNSIKIFFRVLRALVEYISSPIMNYEKNGSSERIHNCATLSSPTHNKIQNPCADLSMGRIKRDRFTCQSTNTSVREYKINYFRFLGETNPFPLRRKRADLIPTQKKKKTTDRLSVKEWDLLGGGRRREKMWSHAVLSCVWTRKISSRFFYFWTLDSNTLGISVSRLLLLLSTVLYVVCEIFASPTPASRRTAEYSQIPHTERKKFLFLFGADDEIVRTNFLSCEFLFWIFSDNAGDDRQLLCVRMERRTRRRRRRRSEVKQLMNRNEG